ncbi:zinc transporter 1-like [Stegodyphus dumicola]|uniref:zinc transporter 1-like n=1 Tax=Stegodyphus dumicola TaxID=202533 RepID=UPI0015AA4BA0|nr:zinc transporter 1-like [Stegodyphus dumicola]
MGRYSGKRCRLLSMFLLTSGYFLVEISVGYVTNSMALVADSFHMLSDVIALIIAFMSVKMSPKKWSKSTFGWARAEVLGALVNAVFLVALCFSIFVESLKRFYTPEEIHDPLLILYVGSFGLLVNIIGLFLFHGHGHSHGGHGHDKRHNLPTLEEVLSEGDINDNKGNYQVPDPAKSQEVAKSTKKDSQSSQMNMHGVFLHVLADALGSVIVIISALIIWLTRWEYRYYVDPALSVFRVCLIMNSTWPLLKDSAMILLQTVPTHIQVDYLQNKLLHEIDGVLAVHEFHVWQLAGERIIASAHICCRNLSDYMAIAEKVKEFFHNEGIHSTTIQPEFVGEATEKGCVLDCPVTTNCTPQTCCGSMKEEKEKNGVQMKPLSNSPLKNGGSDNLDSIKGIYRTIDTSKAEKL